MPIYSATIAGRTKPVLVKGKGLAEASAKLVTLKALTAAEKDDALERGDKVWEPGQDLPEDDKPPVASDDGKPGNEDDA
jgi:hypothetical protein